MPCRAAAGVRAACGLQSDVYPVLEVERQSGEQPVLRGIVAETVVAVIGIARPVGEVLGDRVGPLVANRCLEGDVRSDAEHLASAVQLFNALNISQWEPGHRSDSRDNVLLRQQ